MPTAIADPRTPSPGRGRRRSTEPATERIFCRVTKAERMALEALCAARAQTLAELIRDCLAGELGSVARRPVETEYVYRPAQTDADMVMELRRCGGIFKALMGKPRSFSVAEVQALRQIRALMLKVLAEMGAA